MVSLQDTQVSSAEQTNGEVQEERGSGIPEARLICGAKSFETRVSDVNGCLL